MRTLPVEFISLIITFSPLFSKPVWEHVQVLLLGAILAPGKRTVTSALRVMGLSQEEHFENYHRVLNRAVWSTIGASRRLLELTVDKFAPTGPLVMGLDDTIERRRGDNIKAKGIYRDPVRSSDSHFVKASGLRWLSLMLLVYIPWADRIWALPFLTVLSPSERYHNELGRKHMTLTERAYQTVSLVRRWLPDRVIVVVADSSFATLEFLSKAREKVIMVTRLRMDAALHEPAPEPEPGRKGRPRKKGKRLPNLNQVAKNPSTVWDKIKVENWYGQGMRIIEIASGTAVWYHPGLPVAPIRWVVVRDPQGKFNTQAFLCTDLNVAPAQIVEWFRQRWQVEVTFEESRAHIGVETQRQWSDKAIARTTPVLFGLYSIVTLMAKQIIQEDHMPVRTAAWYEKQNATFSDTIALVRSRLWGQSIFSMSDNSADMIKIPLPSLDRLIDTLCYAA